MGHPFSRWSRTSSQSFYLAPKGIKPEAWRLGLGSLSGSCVFSRWHGCQEEDALCATAENTRMTTLRISRFRALRTAMCGTNQVRCSDSGGGSEMDTLDVLKKYLRIKVPSE